MKIVVDMDGCLADFDSAFAKILNKMQYKKVDIYDDAFPAVWDWMEHYGWSRDIIDRAWTEVKTSGVFWRSLFPYPTAGEDLRFLESIKTKHDIYFVTTRPGATAKQETEEWLIGRGILTPTVIVSANKGLICKGLNADIIIDDSPDNLLDVFGVSINTKCILFKRPYNVGFHNYFFKTVDTIREGLKDVV